MLRPPFRSVDLPKFFSGQLYLTNMPGYWRPAESHVRFWRQLTKGDSQGWVVCLAGEAERKRKAPDYRRFLETAGLRERWLEFPIRDRSIPKDLTALLELLDRIIMLLQQPTIVAIHCAAGVGRTGTVAASLLVRMGFSPEHALAVVEHAGSEPETARQLSFVRTSIPLSGRHLADDRFQQRE